MEDLKTEIYYKAFFIILSLKQIVYYSSREQKGTILTLAAYRKSLESPIDMGFVPLESLNPDEYDDMCFHKKIQKNPPQKKC